MRRQKRDGTMALILSVNFVFGRFFYKHIWMPWDEDSDDDYDWADRHLESRIHFYYDMKKKIKPSLVGHIQKLLIEADYLQQQKKMLENEVDDIDGVDGAPGMCHPPHHEHIVPFHIMTKCFPYIHNSR